MVSTKDLLFAIRFCGRHQAIGVEQHPASPKFSGLIAGVDGIQMNEAGLGRVDRQRW